MMFESDKIGIRAANSQIDGGSREGRMKGSVRGRRYVCRDEYLAHPALYAKRGNDLPHARVTPEIVREIRANRHGWPRWSWPKNSACTKTPLTESQLAKHGCMSREN